MIAGLHLMNGIGTREIIAFYDSQLVVNQFHGDYKANDSQMEAYHTVVKGLAQKFNKFELVRIPRGEKTSADALAALASTFDLYLKRIILVECI